LVGDAKSSLGDTKSSLGDAKSWLVTLGGAAEAKDERLTLDAEAAVEAIAAPGGVRPSSSLKYKANKGNAVPRKRPPSGHAPS
jgi:hypothetical protein